MKSRTDKVVLFIDGPDITSAARSLGFEIDYRRLLDEFEGRAPLLRAFFYCFDGKGRGVGNGPSTDWLSYNGFTVVSNPSSEFIGSNGRHDPKITLQLKLVVDAMGFARYADRMVLFSGAGNFRPLVAALQRSGVRVTVVSTASGRPQTVDDGLRRQADVFEDIAELKSKISQK